VTQSQKLEASDAAEDAESQAVRSDGVTLPRIDRDTPDERIAYRAPLETLSLERGIDRANRMYIRAEWIPPYSAKDVA